MAQVFQSNGTLSGGPATVVAAGSKTTGYLWDVAADATGNFAVLYGMSTYSSTWGWSSPSIRFQRYTSAGAASGSAVTVATPSIGSQTPGLAMDGAGNMTVVWNDFTADSGRFGTYTFYINAQRYTAAGKANGSRITVASLPNTNNFGLHWPNVAMNTAGKFVVTWGRAGTGDGLAQVFNANGTPAGGTVAFGQIGGQRPGLGIDGAGNVTFAWSDGRVEASWSSAFPQPSEGRMARLTAGGVLEPETIVNTTTQGGQGGPGVAPTGSGTFIVAWQGYGPGDDAGVLSQRFAPPPAPLTAVAPGPGSAAPLTAGQVKPLLSEALRRWKIAGADTAALGPIDVRVTDLGGSTLGLASSHTITLDDNAAGWGWFVDRTPRSDSEFRDSAPSNRIDLLTVLMHEVGHLLGKDHGDGVMSEALFAGVRELPDELTPRWGVRVDKR
jgi:hypothetical protein